jgi:uncharacterized protein (DUF58 family)
VKLDLARWNHVLVPPTKAGRDRYRRGRAFRVLRPLVVLFALMSREGRLLATTACVAAAFGADVGRTDAHMLIFGIASLIGASLLFARRYRLAGVTVEVRAPRRVAIGEEIAVTVTLRNAGGAEHRTIRVDPPLLPWDGRWTRPAPTVEALAPHGHASVEVHARFVARGEHQLDPFLAAALVPLGLAQSTPVRSGGVRFVVVPRIAKVTRVTTPTNRRHQPGGVARASRTGDAMELLGVRPYRPGDPVRDLHARSWARVGFPVVREYQQEYFTRVGVVLDTDGTLGDEPRLEGALSLAAGVIAELCRGEALVDLLVVGEEVHALPLGRSLGSLDQALDVLGAVRPGPAFSPDGLLARLGPHLGRLSSVVLVALAWDARRAAVAQGIRRRGVRCTVLVVGDRASLTAEARTVPLDAITRGEALAL